MVKVHDVKDKPMLAQIGLLKDGYYEVDQTWIAELVQQAQDNVDAMQE